MKILLAVLLSASMTVCSFSQDVVSQAKSNIAAAHQKAMVHKAEVLLHQRDTLNAEIKTLQANVASVETKLDKLSKGEDVKVCDMVTYAISRYEGDTSDAQNGTMSTLDVRNTSGGVDYGTLSTNYQVPLTGTKFPTTTGDITFVHN